MIRTTILVMLLVVFGAGCATTPKDTLEKPVYSIACSDLDNYKSVSGTEEYVVTFVNSREHNVEMYWINYEGEEVLKTSISPGDLWSQNTYVSHPWVVRDLSGNCVAAYNSDSTVNIEIR